MGDYLAEEVALFLDAGCGTGWSLPGPRHDGQALLRLTPAEFLNRIAILIPPPRRHRHRYHGVFAPNAPLREQVTKRAGLPVTGEKAVSDDKSKAEESTEQTAGCLFASIRAMLLARIYEINPLVCPRCGGEMRIIAFVTELEPVGRTITWCKAPGVSNLGCLGMS